MSRPKGYMQDWKPQPQTVELLAQVQQVLDRNSTGALTARQIFYQLVGKHGYDKTEQAYARLCEGLVKARRAGIIRFGAIRDDGTKDALSGGYDSVADWWQTVKDSAEWYGRDRAANQDVEVEVWCEAAGMVPQLGVVARRYSVSVYSTGGFSSVTITHEVAQRVLRRSVPTVFLHIGDYDPSGESIFEAMSQDIGAFVVGKHGGKWNEQTGETLELTGGYGCLFKPRRVALTEDQVEEYGLETAPPKRSDTRSNNWVGQTCQAEAMDADDLADLVGDAIEAEYDMDVYRQILEEETEEKETLLAEVEEKLGD